MTEDQALREVAKAARLFWIATKILKQQRAIENLISIAIAETSVGDHKKQLFIALEDLASIQKKEAAID